MPYVVCEYCGYRGKGGSISNQATDVMSHELMCPANPLNKDRLLIIDETASWLHNKKYIPRQ